MIISGQIILFIMRTALAYKSEDDEVPVVSTEVLESNVVAMRGELTELKTDFKEHRKEFTAAVTRLDNDIKAAVTELRTEIRSMAAKAESDLKEFAGRIEHQLREMRAEHIGLRNSVDKKLEGLNAKIDSNHAALNTKIVDLGKNVNKIGAKFNAMLWLLGAIIAGIGFLVTLGKTVGVVITLAH